MNYCSNCGGKLSVDNTYCPTCGILLKKEETKDVTNLNNIQKFNSVSNDIVIGSETSNKKETNAFSIIGFILSLLSLITCGMTSFLGLVFSIIGLATSKKFKNNGKGFSIAGIVISSIFLLLLALLYFLLIVGSLDGTSNTSTYNVPYY